MFESNTEFKSKVSYINKKSYIKVNLKVCANITFKSDLLTPFFFSNSDRAYMHIFNSKRVSNKHINETSVTYLNKVLYFIEELEKLKKLLLRPMKHVETNLSSFRTIS